MEGNSSGRLLGASEATLWYQYGHTCKPPGVQSLMLGWYRGTMGCLCAHSGTVHYVGPVMAHKIQPANLLQQKMEPEVGDGLFSVS